MTISRLAAVAIFLVATNAAADAPRIRAQIEALPTATLTAQEQRAVSIAAGRVLRHAYDAQLALDAEDSKRAGEELALLDQLVRMIENAVPSVTVTATITSGDLRYEHESVTKPATIPIHHELDMVSLTAPLLVAGSDKAENTEGDDPPVGVIAHNVRHLRTTLNLDLAKTGLRTATKGLAKDDIPAAHAGLASIMHSVHFTQVNAEVPLHRAQENLMLAKAAIKRGNNAHAQALLREVTDSLTDIRDVIGKTRQKTIDETQVEILAFADTLAGSTRDSDFAATIDRWWDRIGKLMGQ